jgi:hypothetical protein
MYFGSFRHPVAIGWIQIGVCNVATIHAILRLNFVFRFTFLFPLYGKFASFLLGRKLKRKNIHMIELLWVSKEIAKINF